MRLASKYLTGKDPKEGRNSAGIYFTFENPDGFIEQQEELFEI